MLNFGKIGADSNQLGIACGAAYELEKAYDLVQAGEEVLELGKKFHGREFDIVTKTKLIECKNIDWSKIIGGALEKVKGLIVQQSEIAKKEHLPPRIQRFISLGE